MSHCFLESLNSLPVEGETSPIQLPERERVRVLIISSRDGVISTIHELHSCGFAEAGAWSLLLPAPDTGEVMSILMRDRQKG
jgi:elongation factor P hydroxylase